MLMGVLPDIQVAGATLHSTNQGVSRPCSTCGSPAMRVDHSLGRWIADACADHLATDAAAAIAELALEIEAAGQGQLDADPACWSWPTPANTGGDPYQVLERWHDGRCAICGHAERLVDDHDHDGADGLIRGMLCHGCNIAEGRSGMDIIRKYRERHPAVILGLRIPYGFPFGRPGTAA